MQLFKCKYSTVFKQIEAKPQIGRRKVRISFLWKTVGFYYSILIW